jgi:hypothetical protein
MPGIFISYRREDCPGHAGRIFDRLRARFGPDIVFMDVATIDAGVDFVDVIQRAVGSCDALLAVIGPEWLSAAHAGQRRLDNARDFVRLEIAGALQRDVRVLPVLVDGASMPAGENLPADLQGLTRRQAVELRDARWDDDIDQLIGGLERFLGSARPALASPATVAPPANPTRAGSFSTRGMAIGAAAIVTLALGITFALRGGVNPSSESPPTDAPRQAAVAPAVTPAATDNGVLEPSSTSPPAPERPVSGPATNATDASTPSPTHADTSVIPNVTGKTVEEARELLRRAGMPVRVRYVEDRTKEPGIVQAQALARATDPAQRQLLLVTAIATSTVVVHFITGNERMADDLVTYLRNQPSTATSVIRRQSVSPRLEMAGRVGYSEDRLAMQADAVARDASEYLSRAYDRRSPLQAAKRPPVVRGTIIIGLYDPPRR